MKGIDYELQRDLFCKGAELATDIVESERIKYDYESALRANADGDIWIINHYNPKLVEVTNKLSELLKQLEEVKTQIKAL